MSRHRSAVVATVVLYLAMGAGCGPDSRRLASDSLSWGEMRTVRPGVTVTMPNGASRAPFARERMVDGEKVHLAEGALAWIRRDGGATVLIGGPGEAEMTASSLKMKRGRVFVDAPGGESVELDTPRGTVRLSDARVSFRIDENGHVSAYVLKGRVSFGKVSAGPGQRLIVGKDVKVVPVEAWRDWTGGLATTDPLVSPAPFGVGTIGARKPGETGAPRWPLVIRKMDVKVELKGDLATTEVRQTFFNPRSETVEGVYKFRTPYGAILDRFGVDRNGWTVWGFVKEKKRAASQYASHVYQGSRENPALLEWDSPGVYKARIYPIEAGATRKFVTRYSEWLTRSGPAWDRRLYVYPMAAQGDPSALPRIEELTIRVDLSHAGELMRVRTGLGGERVGDTLVIRKHDYVPRADFAVELFDSGKPNLVAYRARHDVSPDLVNPKQRREVEKLGRGQDDYVLFPLPARLPVADTTKDHGVDLAIVIDTSAATDEKTLALSRALTLSLVSHLSSKDRVVVWGADESIHPIAAAVNGGVSPVTDEFKSKLREGLSRIIPGGATDLASVLSEAARGVDASRPTALVYIGDGKPTVGETDVAGVRKQLQRLPRPVRLYALGVGDDADMSMLAGLAHGGFSARVTGGREAAMTALRVLEQVNKPAWLGTKVDLGAGVQQVYPRDLGGATSGQPLLLVGRVKGKVPNAVTVKTSAGTKTYSVSVQEIDDHGDLMRRWAFGQLAGLLDRGVGRAAVVEVGMRYGMVTPVTSLYVPTTTEARTLGVESHRDDLDEDRRQAIRSGQQKPHWVLRLFRGMLTLSADDYQAESKSVGIAAARPYREVESERSVVRDKEPSGSGTRAKGEEPTEAAEKVVENKALFRGAAEEQEVTKKKSGVRARLRGRARHGCIPGDPMCGNETVADDELEGRGASKRSRKVVTLPPPAPDSQLADTPVARPSTGKGSAGVRFGVSGAGTSAGGSGFGRGHAYARSGRFDDYETIGHGAGTAVSGKDRRTNTVASKKAEKRPAIGLDWAHLRRPSVCGAGARVPLAERVSLWRERFSQAGGSPSRFKQIYQAALINCEAPSWRERSRLLSLMVQMLPSVAARVSLWRMFSDNQGISTAIYGMILSRIRTANQLRDFHRALGLKTLDRQALEHAMRAATTPEQRIGVLRDLVKVWPSDTNLALKLIYALEDAKRTRQTRDLASRLRQRRDLDAATRTEIGELFLRLAGADEKSPDRLEATRAFGELVEFSPDDPVARRRLGDLLRAHGHFVQAQRQYASLALLVPDDPSVSLLRAAAAQGQGKVEEAIRWVEKAAQANAPDGISDVAETARALGLTYLYWAQQRARKENKLELVKKLATRIERLNAADRAARQGIRVTLTWAHPDFHPVMWSDALGSMMPSPDGDPMLGIWQVIVPASRPVALEVRLGDEDIAKAVRFGAEAVLTVMTAADNPPSVLKLRFTSNEQRTLRFRIVDGQVSEVNDD